MDTVRSAGVSRVEAHRIASVRQADRIYVLDHGAVVEQGITRR
jgi:ABC-type multidrug transport system fused ATPase/permease subunit